MFDKSIYHDDRKKRKKFAGVLISSEANVLLGFKKHGFGSGLWNHSFVGKVEDGEAVEATAKRELEEESGLSANIDKLEKVGYLEYEFTDSSICSKIMEMHIFKACLWTGEPKETSEMIPKWFRMSEIPFHLMWADNQYWLEQVLHGNKVKGFCQTQSQL